jgi:hypothetical protein
MAGRPAPNFEPAARKLSPQPQSLCRGSARVQLHHQAAPSCAHLAAASHPQTRREMPASHQVGTALLMHHPVDCAEVLLLCRMMMMMVTTMAMMRTECGRVHPDSAPQPVHLSLLLQLLPPLGRSLPLRCPRLRLLLPCRNASFFEFSLCLSRACLGKMIIYIYKWRKKRRFLTCCCA